MEFEGEASNGLVKVVVSGEYKVLSLKVKECELPENVYEKIREYATKAFLALDGAGLARVDFFVKYSDNSIILNEVNTMPGFTDGSLYARMIEAYGISESGLFSLLIDNCVCRG